MRSTTGFIKRNQLNILLYILVIVVLCGLFLHRLGSITAGFSLSELNVIKIPVGWHGIYNSPLYLPLKIIRSIVFWLVPNHDLAISRLPNAIFGGLLVLEFSTLIKLWYGRRSSFLASCLFATAAWTLHVSRLATNGITFLSVIPTLLLIVMLLSRYGNKRLIWYGCILASCLTLYIPGAIWLVVAELYFSRKIIKGCWRHYRQLKDRIAGVTLVLLSLIILAIDFPRPGQFILWLGLPSHWHSIVSILKQFLLVPVHLFISGPNYPTVWLGHAPLLDFSSLVFALLGIYFYARHAKSSRIKQLATLFLISWVLIALQGPVYLSLIVPIVYILVATGIAYFIQRWLLIFPSNLFAQTCALALIGIVIVFSITYNLRAYFVAWPHNAVTRSSFHYKP